MLCDSELTRLGRIVHYFYLNSLQAELPPISPVILPRDIESILTYYFDASESQRIRTQLFLTLLENCFSLRY